MTQTKCSLAVKIIRFDVHRPLILLACAVSCLAAYKDCDFIDAANNETTHSQYTTINKTTGVVLGPYMSKFVMHSTVLTCKFVREDSSEGQAAVVYTQHFEAPEGTADEEIWISKKSNRILREEIEGKITGKGSGHFSLLFRYK